MEAFCSRFTKGPRFAGVQVREPFTKPKETLFGRFSPTKGAFALMNPSPTKALESRSQAAAGALGHPRLWMLQGGFLLALCLSALVERIPLPFTPVPMTLQVFVVYLAALTLGANRSLPVVAGYLLLGAAGLPVFSGGAAGFGHLFGATGGYLLGFLPAAWLVGAGIQRNQRPEHGLSRFSLIRDAAVLASALTLIYLLGSTWLWAVTGLAWHRVLALAVFPFVVLDLVKIATAYSIWRLSGRRIAKFLS